MKCGHVCGKAQELRVCTEVRSQSSVGMLSKIYLLGHYEGIGFKERCENVDNSYLLNM